MTDRADIVEAGANAIVLALAEQAGPYTTFEPVSAADVALTAMLPGLREAFAEHILTAPFSTHGLQRHERNAAARLIREVEL